MRLLRLFQLGLALLCASAATRAPAMEELETEETISELLEERPVPREEQETAEQRRWALLPEFGYGPDTGPMAGAKITDRDIYGSGATFDLEGTYALKEQQGLTVALASPHLLEDRVIVQLRTRYRLDPQREFFGVGNNEVGPDPASTHLVQDTSGTIGAGWRAFQRLSFNAEIALRKVDIRRGNRKDDFPFTPDAFPTLPGVHGGTINRFGVSLVWDTRDSVGRPTRGWRTILKIAHTDKALFSDFEYTRYVLDVGYLRSFVDRRYIVALRANGAWIDGPSEQIPFWELEELGGSDTLRGFFPHRFLGKGRVLLNGEFRFRVTEFDFFNLWHVRLDGVLFGDGGRVFIDQSEVHDEFHLNEDIFGRSLSDFQYSYGGGIRIALAEALVARIDAGFSDEETGLIYLSFGQTF